MPNLQIIINNKIATYVKRSGAVVCGNSDYVAEFAFDQEWDAHESKIARFTWGGKYVDLPIQGSTCQVPQNLWNSSKSYCASHVLSAVVT